ncbi:Ubiquinol-cytochrome C reductase hinge domain - like 2, partial [Theobroma cacao]
VNRNLTVDGIDFYVSDAFGEGLYDSCKEECVKRIQGDESGHKHSTGQYFDYWSCVDKCVAPKLFSELK